MKKEKVLTICAFVMLTSVLTAFINKGEIKKSNSDKVIEGGGFAVLELFTSEGCSSCPAADELMGKIQKEMEDKPVYVLSYHVDYWDRLGWKDVFSSAANSERQYQYSQILGSQVYTPQVVVNGKQEFIGSDRKAADNILEAALKGSSPVSLNLKVRQQLKDIQIDFLATGVVPKDKLFVAVVQRHAVRNIKRGENEGRTLHHYQIVQKLYSFEINSTKKGSHQLQLPDGFNLRDWEIIGFIQNQDHGGIKAAVRASIQELSSGAQTRKSQ